MKRIGKWIYTTSMIGMIVAIVLSCAPPPMRVFLSPNPEFETAPSQRGQLQQPQSVMVQPAPSQSITTQQMFEPKTDRIVTQMLEALAEAQAHLHAGEARLQENNLLEGIREIELARRLIEEDFDPSLNYIQQLPKVQGGMSVLSDQRIQHIQTQRTELLARLNQAYDFQALYGKQQETDRINALRAQDTLVLKPLTIVQAPAPTLTQEDQEIDLYINLFQQRRTEFSAFLLRADQYFPIVTRILSSSGVPEELVFVALIESGFRSSLSSQGRVGVWQLPRDVAQQYGLEVSSRKDERKDIEASTRAFAGYISSLYRRFGSWDLAVLAYDMGPQRLQQAINRAGTYQLQTVRKHLGNEWALLAKLDAAKTIARNPQKYGFNTQLPNIAGPSVVQARKPVEKVMMEPPAVLSYPGTP